MTAETFGVPYFRAVEGPDGLYHWASCPACGEIVLNSDGYGPARHWPTHDAPAEIVEVWCQDCAAPATGPDALCDFHRSVKGGNS